MRMLVPMRQVFINRKTPENHVSFETRVIIEK